MESEERFNFSFLDTSVKPQCFFSSRQVRKLISDFAIILTILLFCGVDALVGVNTPKLIVPSEFKVHPAN